MFEGCKEINDYIEEIFRLGLKEDYSRIINSNEIEGYYLSIPSRNTKSIPNLSQWERLFINIKTKSARIYGNKILRICLLNVCPGPMKNYLRYLEEITLTLIPVKV